MQSSLASGTVATVVEPGRERAGPHQEGGALVDPGVVIRDVEVLYAGWQVLRRATYDLRRHDGSWTTQDREYDDVGDGAAVLLHDLARGVVLLTRQFRVAAHAGGHGDGMLIEVPAGAQDGEDPAAAARREVAEEVGVDLVELIHILTTHTSAGSISQRIHCYASAYTPAQRTAPGGGLAHEGEDVEVIELAFTEALAMVYDGRITDAKTIMLLQWAALEGPFADHPRC